MPNGGRCSLNCPRCHRQHRGPCGIPPLGVRVGMGLGVGGGVGKPSAYEEPVQAARARAEARGERLLNLRGQQRLKGLLEWGREHEAILTELLAASPSDELMGKLEQVQAVIQQTMDQLELAKRR